MKTAGDLLREKGDQIWSVEPATSVYDGLRLMAEKNIGALLVLEDGDLVGIFSERDYARKVILRGRSSREMLVRHVMSPKVVAVEPDESIDECMALMNEKHFRHLPVSRGKQLLGVISSTDVVRAIISEQRLIIDQLESHIGQRKQYADALQRREAELRSVLETVVEGILTFDSQGTIDSFNPAAGRIFDYEPEEATGMDIGQLLHDDSNPRLDDSGLPDLPLAEVGGGLGKGREVLGKRKGGRTFPLHLAVSRRGQGDQVRFTAVVRDLTDFKRMQRKVLQAETLAAIGEMAASVAHEIKNPLAGIGGAIQVLEESFERNDTRRQLMQEILAQVDRLDTTVRQLLMLARPQTPQKQRCDLRALLERVIATAKRQDSFREISFVFEGREALFANVDPYLFEQVIWNLLDNSSDAMPEGGQITFSLDETPDGDILRIKDTGPGVHPELRKKLFRPFFTTKTRGTGLGLSICKKIVDGHDGSIRISSDQKKGFQVELTFPN